MVDVNPKLTLTITYPDDKSVELGNELAPKQVRATPSVKYEGSKDAYYTLIMTDPDAPSRKNPVAREFNHWLVVNIPGSDVEAGETLTAYLGSGPPKDTGLHRYVFYLFQQPGKLDFSGEAKHDKFDGNRKNFSTAKFVEKYKLGEAVAGNFYQAQYDDSVPALHKQIASH